MKSSLTPAQQQQNARIMAQLYAPEPTPAGCCMSLKQMLNTYTPPNGRDLSQRLTPLPVATRILEELRLNFNQALRVLVPGAGIGHLICPLLIVRDTAVVDAYEIEEELCLVGRGLFPWVNWYNLTPFPAISVIEGQYDLVLCNPPLGTEKGLRPGRKMCSGRANRSEYIFFELSIRALRSGGQAIFLSSEFFMRRMSRPLGEWLADRAEHIRTIGPLTSGLSGDLYARYYMKSSTDLGTPWPLQSSLDSLSGDSGFQL